MPDLPELRFSSIRAHLGSQTKGFEELVAQVFRLDTQNQGQYHRVEGAGGDGGVEAYTVRPDGSKIGVQSKFFEKVKAPQWKQIEKSVHAAIANHPELAEYRIAVPIDRNGTQIKTWNNKVTTWNRYATSHGFTRPIQFVWLGTSELIGELLKPACAQAQVYWFGLPQFTDEWMDRVFRLALENLDKRYSPAEHVNTEAGRELQAFAHSPSVGAQLKRQFLQVLTAWEDLHADIGKSSAFPFNRSQMDKLMEAVTAFKGLSWPERSLPSLRNAATAATAIRDIWLPLHVEIEKENEKAKAKDPHIPSYYQTGPHDHLLYLSEKFFRQIENWHQLTSKFRCADSSKVLLYGDAGNGKSHVLAAVVDEARKRKQPALLLLGEQFSEQTPLTSQIASVTDWGSTPDTLLTALNQSALAFGAPALLFIDAINETAVQNLWFSKIGALNAKLADYPNVRLAISCRSDFLHITLPDAIVQQHDLSWAYVVHEGLGESLFAAVGKYFERFHVKASHFPPPLPEFGNPLFLRLFCETFENSQIPEGPLSFSAVMQLRIDRLATKLLHEIDCPEDNTRDAVLALARAIQDNGGRAIPRRNAQKIVDDLSPSKQRTKSLYHHLKSNNIIVETLPRPFEPGNPKEVNVRFAFERFADYSIATELLRSIPDAKQLKQELRPQGKLAWLGQVQTYFKNRGVARALTIAIPERFGIELLDLLPKIEFGHFLLEDFLQSFVWRSPASFNVVTRRLFERATEQLEQMAFETLLMTATLPGHPYNALYLHQQLLQLPLPERELKWTIPLTRMAEPYHSRPSQILRWAFLVPLDLISDEQARLAGYLLLWFLSSNFRGLRHRASLAAIRILQGRSKIVAELLNSFAEINDPYVQERMYAVACGVAMRERGAGDLKALATTVFQRVFKPRYVNPHILLRDYARAILEVAAHRGCLPDGITKDAFKLPLRSKWPRIITDKTFKEMAASKEWGRIIHSTKPNTGLGMYGDFGRYTMQHAVQLFSRVRLNKPFKATDRDSFFNADMAQRWTLQRAANLGWTVERFDTYDKNCRSGRGGSADDFKIERIGKKCQWIALHELLGFLTDHFHMAIRWNSDPPRAFVGAWQLSVRDFDPSQPLVDVEDGEADEPVVPEGEKTVVGYPDPFGDTKLNANREAWVTKRPDGFEGIIQVPRLAHEPNAEWLVLFGYYEWTEPEFQTFQLSAQGQLKMWGHLRSWLVKKTDLNRFLSDVRTYHFWGHGISLVSNSAGWIGEYPWGAQFQTMESECAKDDDFLSETEVSHTYTVCGLGSSERMIAPSPQLYRLMGLQWSGKGTDFIDANGVLQVTQLDRTTGFDNKPCVVRKSALLEALDRHGYAIVWGALGERDCYSYKLSVHTVAKDAQFSGVYQMKNGGVAGKITKHLIQSIPRDF